MERKDKGRVLTEWEANALEEPIYIRETYEALISRKNNKCPGIDGLTKEFYCEFFDLLGPLFVELYEEAFRSGLLNPTARKGIISLLPKPQKNLLELTSWRPLTLLCVDFKILSKILAERMKPMLEFLISEEQTGFMKGRQISENLRRTFEIIQYTKTRKIPSMILSIDFYKCFDTISHNAFEGALKCFNFGTSYTRWVMTLFADMQIYNLNFGKLSTPFTKGRGINQGCCLSPFCFLLCSEIMSRELKANQKIQGINMKKGSIKNLLSQFADDTVLFLKYDDISLNEVINTFTHIEANTGLKISYEKTLIYRIGSIANTNAKIYTQREISWTNDPINILGVQVSNTEANTSNYQPIVEKMENTLAKWSNRPMPLMAKTMIVNTLCESLFVYKLSVTTDVPTEVVKHINKTIVDFVWNGKKAKIAKDTLQTNKECGGA